MQFASEFADEYGDWLSGSRPAQRARWLDRTLGELPRETPLCVGPELSVRSVVEQMKQANRSAVLVMEDCEVRGIFTERDVLSRVVAREGMLERPVAAVMTEAPHTLTEQTQLGAALRILALGSYHHLPVLNAMGRPLGLVSLQNILAYLAEQFPTEILNAPPEEANFPSKREGG